MLNTCEKCGHYDFDGQDYIDGAAESDCRRYPPAKHVQRGVCGIPLAQNFCFIKVHADAPACGEFYSSSPSA